MDAKVPLILEQLRRSPSLRLLVGELEEYLHAESEKRRAFYESLTEDSNVEFINGERVARAPSTSLELEATLRISTVMDTFVQVHCLGVVAAQRAMVSLSRNDYEPDVSFWGHTKSRYFSPNQLSFPPPDLVVEVVSRSSEPIDREIKFDDTLGTASASIGLWTPRRDAGTVLTARR